MALEHFEVEIPCPGCKREFPQRLEDMRPGNSRTCPHCGDVINFTGDDGRKAQEALTELERVLDSLKDIGR